MNDPVLAAKHVERDLAREPVVDLLTAMRSRIAEAQLCCYRHRTTQAHRRRGMDVSDAKARVDAFMSS